MRGYKPRNTGSRKWTPKEDEALVAALCELCNSGWRRENGTFKNGYTAALELKIKSRLPGCNIRASPHIESRLKVLKKHYDAITEMQCADGIKWDSEAKILICEDDDVWEKWVETHADAKGLRNMEFPHYAALHLLFGNSGTRKGVNNELDGDKVLDYEDTIYDNNLIVDDSLEVDDKGNNEVFQDQSFCKEIELRANNEVVTVARTNYKVEHFEKWKAPGDIPNGCLFPDQEEARYQDDDDNDSTGSDEENTARKEAQTRASTKRALKRKRRSNGDSGSSELGELAKIFGDFLEKYGEHLSLMGEIVKGGKEAEKITSEKRARLNGELKKLPSLTLQARLRAASLIVSNPAKLDLFYSLSTEERREWVSMLLTGLV